MQGSDELYSGECQTFNLYNCTIYHVQNLSRISLSQFQAIAVLFPAVLP